MAKIKTEVEKLKVGLNRKIALGIFSMAMCLALIIVCSFMPFIIDPKRWQTNEFLTDELLISAIVIMSMVSMVFVSQAANAQNVLSRLAKARSDFFISVERITGTDVNAFRQWIRKVLQISDIKSIKKRRLRKIGIDDTLILELDDDQIKMLENGAQKFPIVTAEKEEDREGRYFKRLTKEQIKGVLMIKRTEFKMKFVEPEYYLSVKNLTDTRTVSERAINEDKKKRFVLSSSILSKLVITIVSAMIFASLARDLAETVDKATAWLKFISRVWAMITSSFFGYIVGVQMNDIDAEYIEMRMQIHTRFIQDKDFKPLSLQDEAKEEYERNHRPLLEEPKKDEPKEEHKVSSDFLPSFEEGPIDLMSNFKEKE